MKLVSDQDTSAAAQSYVSHYCPSAKLHRGHVQDICVPLQHNAAVKENSYSLPFSSGSLEERCRISIMNLSQLHSFYSCISPCACCNTFSLTRH